MKQCPNCGTKNADSAKQCNFCEEHFPETTPSRKEVEYIHNKEAEKKHAKTKKVIISLVIALLIFALVGLLVVIFSGDKATESEKLAKIITDSLSDGKIIKGTAKSKTSEFNFSIEIKSDSTSIVINKENESSKITLTKNACTISKGDVIQTVTEDMDLYKLYIAYLTISNIKSNKKNPLNYETEDIEKVFVAPVKEKYSDNFDETFIEENFISAVSSILMIFESTPDLEMYFGITLDKDVNNGEFSFDVSSYAFQNRSLSLLKKAFKNQEDYEALNESLKNSKSKVKNSYGAKGTFKTEHGKLTSANAKITYGGYAYDISLTIE